MILFEKLILGISVGLFLLACSDNEKSKDSNISHEIKLKDTVNIIYITRPSSIKRHRKLLLN